jgi:hypothetical protein
MAAQRQCRARGRGPHAGRRRELRGPPWPFHDRPRARRCARHAKRSEGGRTGKACGRPPHATCLATDEASTSSASGRAPDGTRMSPIATAWRCRRTPRAAIGTRSHEPRSTVLVATCRGMALSAFKLLANIVGTLVLVAFYLAAKGFRRLVKTLTSRFHANARLVFGRLAQGAIVILGPLVSASIVVPSFKGSDVMGILGIRSRRCRLCLPRHPPELPRRHLAPSQGAVSHRRSDRPQGIRRNGRGHPDAGDAHQDARRAARSHSEREPVHRVGHPEHGVQDASSAVRRRRRIWRRPRRGGVILLDS